MTCVTPHMICCRRAKKRKRPDTIEKRAKNHAAEFASTCESGRGATVVNEI